MSADRKVSIPEKGLGRYIWAMHGNLVGWAQDVMVSCASWIPGWFGIAFRALWNRIWIRGTGFFAVESGARILGSKYISIDRGVFLDRGVYLHGRPGGLHIGAQSRVMQGAVIHVYNFRNLDNSGIRIGRNCVIGFNCIISGQGGVEIGDDVIMAPGVMVLPVDHVFEAQKSPIREQGITTKGIRIEKGAWIGARALILDGVTIGENAVVGAGAVVTKDVPPRVVVAGNPATVVKKVGEGTEADV